MNSTIGIAAMIFVTSLEAVSWLCVSYRFNNMVLDINYMGLAINKVSRELDMLKEEFKESIAFAYDE